MDEQLSCSRSTWQSALLYMDIISFMHWAGAGGIYSPIIVMLGK